LNLTPREKYDKLHKLVEVYGCKDIQELLTLAMHNSMAPSICLSCGATAEMEKDQDEGYCEECGENTVVSCLVLAGLI
jgi:predicted RNA-binding Zn-ribbon protein involved in translation (DUF1610 family)